MTFIKITGGVGKPRRVELNKRTTTIGKKQDNDIELTEEGVSRCHCEILRDGGVFYVRDLDSKNGTFLNGKRVLGLERLENGSVIQLGSYHLTLQQESEERAVQPPTVQPPRELKSKLHEQLLQEMDLKHKDFTNEPEQDLRIKTVKTVQKLVQKLSTEIPSGVDKELLTKEIIDEALGLGPLEDLLADDDISEIMVNGWNNIYVERSGKIEKIDKCFTDNQQVLSVIRRIIAPIGRRVDESSPMVDARLPDGSRVNAIIPPLALGGPTITIRKFSAAPLSMRNLIAFGTITENIASFLNAAVTNRANICISGGTGSGKTTLLNVMAGAIPEGERIITIEDAAELKLPQEHVVSLESKPPNIAGEGAIRIRELVMNSLRMRPDRIVVGECRGGEALDMLQAMNTGHDGSLTTLHANSPRDALRRLETMVLMAGMDLPSRAIREQIASAINLIVHIARLTDGTRKITSIVEITGMEGDTILSQEIFRFKQTGHDDKHRVMGKFESTGMIPRFVQDLREKGIAVDLKMFSSTRKES